MLRAEKLLLAREGGTDLRLRQEDRREFEELHGLERRIGKTVMLALWPHLHFSRQELWELYELENEAFPAVASKRGWWPLARPRSWIAKARRRLRPAVKASHRMSLALHRWLRAKMRRAM